MQIWVFQIALFKVFPNIPHAPPPPPYGTLTGHKSGNKCSDPQKRTKLAQSRTSVQWCTAVHLCRYGTTAAHCCRSGSTGERRCTMATTAVLDEHPCTKHQLSLVDQYRVQPHARRPGYLSGVMPYVQQCTVVPDMRRCTIVVPTLQQCATIVLGLQPCTTVVPGLQPCAAMMPTPSLRQVARRHRSMPPCPPVP